MVFEVRVTARLRYTNILMRPPTRFNICSLTDVETLFFEKFFIYFDV